MIQFWDRQFFRGIFQYCDRSQPTQTKPQNSTTSFTYFVSRVGWLLIGHRLLRKCPCSLKISSSLPVATKQASKQVIKKPINFKKTVNVHCNVEMKDK